MASSPHPATWSAGESDAHSGRKAVGAGQFVSNGSPGSGSRESLSTVLAEIVAKTKGIDPTDSEFRLYEHLDTEALDAMYDHARRQAAVSWHLEFTIGDETVHVRSDGSIEVTRTVSPD